MIEDTLKTHGVLAGMRVPTMALNQMGIINAYGNITYAQNVLEFGTNTVNGAVTQTQIRSIDKKLDDGLAASGIIRSSGYGSGSTTIYASDPTFPLSTSNKSGATHCVSSGVYSGSATSLECNMIFVLGN